MLSMDKMGLMLIFLAWHYHMYTDGGWQTDMSIWVCKAHQ